MTENGSGQLQAISVREPAVTRIRIGPVRRRHPVRVLIIVLIVLIALLVAADFAARAFAENKAASEIQQQGFPKKPSVRHPGVPVPDPGRRAPVPSHQYQLEQRHRGPAGHPSINASLKNVHINGAFSGGTIGTLHGTATITFTALANAVTSQAGPLGQLANAGLTFSQAGPNEVKASLNVVVFSGTAVWRVTRTAGKDINIQLVSTGGLPLFPAQPRSATSRCTCRSCRSVLISRASASTHLAWLGC